MSRKSSRAVAFGGAVVFLAAGLPMAAATPLETDAFSSATVAASTPGTRNPSALFDGSARDPENVTFFPDLGEGGVGRITFGTSPLTLTGVRLLASNDGAENGYRRAMKRFRFFADTNGDGTFTNAEMLVDKVIDYDYLGQEGDQDEGPRSVEFDLTFPATTASRWRIAVFQATEIGAFEGVRVEEIDAIT